MSETDDTDVLLLIPPKFFLVKSSGSEDSLLESSRTVVHKPTSCTARVLGKLVDQVSSLESRLDSLELSDTLSHSGTYKQPWDTDSYEDKSVDRTSYTFPRRRRRRLMKRSKRSDLSLTSIDSVYSRNIPPLQLKEDLNDQVSNSNQNLNELPNMDGDISSIVSTPNKKNDKLLLHEIDEFLTKVEAYESPDAKHREQEASLSPENLIKATGDYISHKFTAKDEVKLPSGRMVPSDILDKYIYLVRNHSDKTLQPDKSVTTSAAQHYEPLHKPQEDVSKSIQETPTINQDSKSPSIRKLNFTDNKDFQPTSTPKKPVSSTNYSDFRPSSNKIYNRATKVLEQYKSNNYIRTQNSLDANYALSPKKEEFKMPQMRQFADHKDIKFLQNKLLDTIDTDLLSLSDLWGEKGEKGSKEDSTKLEEERLKREHCEAMIQELQKNNLDQQERLAVAMKVDRSKDHAIAKLREAWIKLTGSLDRAEARHRAALDKMVREVDNFKLVADEAQKKTNHFEAELYKALDLAHDYQDKCKHLAMDAQKIKENTDKLVAEKDELIAKKNKEIEILKENYDTVMTLNKQSTECVRSLEEALEKERSEHEMTNHKVVELQRRIQSHEDDASLAMQERDILKDKVNEERARCNILERQLYDKQGQTSDLMKRCDNLDSEVKSLQKQLELQKGTLRAHFQSQLEQAVMGKLTEFQQQLDLAESEREREAREKENAIVDSFSKQIERIEEQHKLEVRVLEEKHREEVNLYRLQAAQAHERAGMLEAKLASHRQRRSDIAAQLHSVMEAQWRQALRILSGERDVSTPLQEPPAPPAPPAAPPRVPRNDSLSEADLQRYVKLLLSKSPNLDASDITPSLPDSEFKELKEFKEVNEEPTSDRPDKDRKGKRSLNSSKPPWKA